MIRYDTLLISCLASCTLWLSTNFLASTTLVFVFLYLDSYCSIQLPLHFKDKLLLLHTIPQ